MYFYKTLSAIQVCSDLRSHFYQSFFQISFLEWRLVCQISLLEEYSIFSDPISILKSIFSDLVLIGLRVTVQISFPWDPFTDLLLNFITRWILLNVPLEFIPFPWFNSCCVYVLFSNPPCHIIVLVQCSIQRHGMVLFCWSAESVRHSW